MVGHTAEQQARVEKAKKLDVMRLQQVHCYGDQNMAHIPVSIKLAADIATDLELHKIAKDIDSINLLIITRQLLQKSILRLFRELLMI